MEKTQLAENECTRADLVAWMRSDYDTRAALFSLPFACVLFILFILMTSQHVDVPSAFFIISGFSKFAGDPGFNDVGGLQSYIKGTLLGSMLVQDLQYYPNPGRIGSYQQIIGGMRITVLSTPPYSCKLPPQYVRVYDNAFQGRCFKSPDINQLESRTAYFFYHMDKAESQAKFANLSSWFDVNATGAEIEFMLYNGHYRVFTHYDMTATFDNVGKGKLRIERESWRGDPYFDWQPWLFDALFIVLIGRMIYTEMKQLLPALSQGIQGLFGYLGFWSMVDWTVIFLGFGILAIWGVTVKFIYVDFRQVMDFLPNQELDAAVSELDSYLNGTYMNKIVSRSGRMPYEESAAKVLDTAKALASVHGYMRLAVFLYVFVLVLKFFKAFRANPRLDVVVRTLTGSTVDVVHFALVFFSILAVFAYSGFFGWGSQTAGQEGEAYYALIHMWQTIVGNEGVGSPTGTYEKTLFRIWLLVYAFLVLNILLGMLIGVVFDAYFGELGRVSNPMTLAEQVREALRRVPETRGFVDQYLLLVQLEDKSHPAHPAKVVTSQSLKSAFSENKMSKKNAQWLIKQANKYAKSQTADETIGLSDVVRIIGQVSDANRRLAELADRMLDRLQDLRREPQNRRYDAIIAGKNPDEVVFDLGPTTVPMLMPVATSTTTIAPQAGSSILSRAMLADQPGGYTTTLAVPAQTSAAITNAPAEDLSDVERLMKEMMELESSFAGLGMSRRRVLESIHQQMAHQDREAQAGIEWFKDTSRSQMQRVVNLESGLGILGDTFQGVDLNELPDLQQQVHEALDELCKEAEDKVIERRKERAAELGQRGVRPEPESKRPDMTLDEMEKMSRQIADKVGGLLASAQEASEVRQLLWKLARELPGRRQ